MAVCRKDVPGGSGTGVRFATGFLRGFRFDLSPTMAHSLILKKMNDDDGDGQSMGFLVGELMRAKQKNRDRKEREKWLIEDFVKHEKRMQEMEKEKRVADQRISTLEAEKRDADQRISSLEAELRQATYDITLKAEDKAADLRVVRYMSQYAVKHINDDAARLWFKNMFICATKKEKATSDDAKLLAVKHGHDNDERILATRKRGRQY